MGSLASMASLLLRNCHHQRIVRTFMCANLRSQQNVRTAMTENSDNRQTERTDIAENCIQEPTQTSRVYFFSKQAQSRRQGGPGGARPPGSPWAPLASPGSSWLLQNSRVVLPVNSGEGIKLPSFTKKKIY